MPILEGQSVTKHFGGLAAVSNVDFSVEKGEIFGLIGPNGAGKTTLFNLISASLSLKSGSILFEGQEISGLKPYKICRLGIARTFQTVKIFPDLPVLSNVILGLQFGVHKLMRNNMNYSYFGIEFFCNKRSKELSVKT